MLMPSPSHVCPVQEVLDVLIQMNAMERNSLAVLPLGLVARNIQVGRQGVPGLWPVAGT